MAASIYDLSTTAASNTTVDGTDVSGATGKVKDGDNVMRSLAAFMAQELDDLGAVNTVAGTGDAITVTLSSGIAAYATGQIFRFIASAANTTNVTMNVNSIGAKAVRKISGGTDVALVAGDLAAGETYTVRYSSTANAAAGAWVLVGSSAFAFSKGTDIASAGTISIGSSNFYHITGTTTITDIDWASAVNGSWAWLEFDGILTLTHNSTTLVLPGGANITTAAGDRALFIQDSGDNAHCLAYQRVGGAPSGGINLGTPTASTSGTTIDYNSSVPPWAKRINVFFKGVSVNGADHLLIQLGDSGGIETSGYVSTAAVVGGTQVTSTAGFIVYLGNAGQSCSGKLTIDLENATNFTWIASGSLQRDDGFSTVAAGYKATSAQTDRVRITAQTPNTFDLGEVNVSFE